MVARLRAILACGGHHDNAYRRQHNTLTRAGLRNPGIRYREPSHPNRSPLSLRCLLLATTGIVATRRALLLLTATHSQLDVARSLHAFVAVASILLLNTLAGHGARRTWPAHALPVLVQGRVLVGRRGQLETLLALPQCADHTADQTRPRIHRRRPHRVPQRRRWLVVDGPLEARPPHGRTVSLQLRRTAARGLPAMEPQREPHDGEHVATEQRPTHQAATPEGEDVPQALHGLRRSRGTQPSRCCAPDRKGRRLRTEP